MDGEAKNDLRTTRRDKRVESGRREQGPERAKLADARREYACDVGVVRYAQTVPGIACRAGDDGKVAVERLSDARLALLVAQSVREGAHLFGRLDDRHALLVIDGVRLADAGASVTVKVDLHLAGTRTQHGELVGKLHLDEGLDDGKQRLAKGGGVGGTQIRLLALVAVHVLEKGQTV